MEILFNTSSSAIYDFIRVIVEHYNDLNLSIVFDNLNIEKDRDIEKSKINFWSEEYNHTPGLAIFFQKQNNQNSFFSYLYSKKTTKFGSIQDLLNDFFRISSENLLHQLLHFYDLNENNDKFYVNLVTDNALFYDYVSSMDYLNEKQRLELIGIHLNRTSIMTPLNEFLHIIKNKILKIYHENNDKIRTFEKIIKIKIKNNPDEFIESLQSISNKTLIKKDLSMITITYSFLYEILFHTIGTTNKILVLGINYDKFIKKSQSVDDTVLNKNFLKAFSDPNRIEIIRMLNEKEMFVGEITKNCKLAFSTTSYHIDILLNAGILSRRISNRRVYYTLNVEYIAKKLDLIKNSICTNTF